MQKPLFFPENPSLVWGYFHALTQLPRPSKYEDKVRDFILNEAKTFGHKTDVDSVGNVIVYVPASSGYEHHETVIIQNHMDMVTDAVPEKKINFQTDPICTQRDGDWIKAQGTTLGADNGLGCAAALALMAEKNLLHPPLELLFTVDEETGLKGAWGVDPEKLSGKKMLNLDTEEWGSFYIGCAGGIEYELTSQVSMQKSLAEGSFYKLTVGGFLGGHSGVDIHSQRGNALKFLAMILDELDFSEVELAEWRGGKAHNIIPRDAFAILKIKDQQKVISQIEKVARKWHSFLPAEDQHFHYSISPIDGVWEVLVPSEARKYVDLLLAFPHGAHAYHVEGESRLVSLSNNLANSLLVRGQFYLQTSLRFFDRDECDGLEKKTLALARIFELDVKKNGEYPSWKPLRNNKLLDLVCDHYQRLFHQKPIITAIHAGLECGILRDKIGPIDIVSFGPTIMGAHSPEERVLIPTVESFWKLLKEVLKSL
jgi:dipeptidase D